MPKLRPYRTSDISKKITTYLFENATYACSFDFGSIDISINDVKKLDYIFITHEHMDHFAGLLNLEYMDALLNSKCKIYASNVSKDLIIALFENFLRVELNEKETKKVRELLNSIISVLFFEKIEIRKDAYIKMFPSGHTYGSSMVYLHSKDCNILYTGDIDYSEDDSDRQYKLDLQENEVVDYIIADGTYFDDETNGDKELNKVRDNILNKGYNNFYCKLEKIIFFSKKLIAIPKLKDDYCIVFPKEFKWYLQILKDYCYDPFITDQIVLDSDVYKLPENRKHLFITNKRTEEKQLNVSGLVGLHISFSEFSYLLQQLYPSKPTILVGHYDEGGEDVILDTFHSEELTSEYNVVILKDEEITL